MRNAIVAFTSAAVLFGGALYVAAPSQVAWAISFKHREVKHVDRHATGPVVLYGSASDEHGKGVPGVQIVLVSAEHRSGPLATLVSGADGTYRQTVSLRKGEYVLSVVKGSGRRHDADGTSKHVKLKPGETYSASVHVKHFGHLFFLPISSY